MNSEQLHFIVDSLFVEENTITYFAVGAAHHQKMPVEKNQQTPPFLADLIAKHSDVRFNVVIIDCDMEAIPLTVEEYHLNETYRDGKVVIYSRENLNVYSLKLEFSETDFDAWNWELMKICFRMIHTRKIQRPFSTNLILFHTFCGFNTFSFRTYLDEFWIKSYFRREIYEKNILIDLSYGKNVSCFPKMEKDVFGPILYRTDENALEIFDPLRLSKEHFWIFNSFEFKNPLIKMAMDQIIQIKQVRFTNVICSAVRRALLILKRDSGTRNSWDDIKEVGGLDYILNEIKGTSDADLANEEIVLDLRVQLNVFFIEVLKQEIFYMMPEDFFAPMCDFLNALDIDPYEISNVYLTLVKNANLLFEANKMSPSQINKVRLSYIREHESRPVWDMLLQDQASRS